jgi:large subunit ribosomal protein L14
VIQTGTLLNVIDNSGARTAVCLKVRQGYRRRYANIGDIITVSVKTIRSKRKETIRVKKGEIYKAVILQARAAKRGFCGDFSFFLQNPCIFLLNKQNKILGTRIFGSVLKSFRFSRYLKIISLSSGISSF